MSNLKYLAVKATKWTTIATLLKTFFQIIQLVILARYLSVESFGLVALVMVVIGFAQIFIDMGISNAIIHKQEVNEIQLSSLYWLNIIFGLILTIVVSSLSPYISSFYSENRLTELIIILSWTFFINSIGNQHRVLLKKNLEFGVVSKIEIFGVFTSFIVSVVLAILGFEAYSLVYATLISSIFLNISFFLFGIKIHKPRFLFNYSEIRYFLNFGLYQMGQNFIVYFNNQFDVIIIGKLLGTESVGAYNLIKQLVMRPSQVISPIVTNVSFPVMAKVQNDNVSIRRIYLKIISYLTTVNFPIYILMIVFAEPLINVLIGKQWVEYATLFQILSCYAIVRLISSPSGSLILVKGRPEIGLWWSIVSFLFTPLAIIIGINWNEVGASFALLLYQFIFLIPNWYFIIYKMCGLSGSKYFTSMLPALISPMISSILVLIIINVIKQPTSVEFFAMFVSSLIITIALSMIFNKVVLKEIFTYAYSKQ